MRPTPSLLRTTLNTAKRWKPRPTNPPDPTLQFERGPELFHQRIVLSDGSSFVLRSTSPRPQIKLSKDTRNHPLWNPQSELGLKDESGFLGSFQRRYGDIDDIGGFEFDDDADIAKEQRGTNEMMQKKRNKNSK
ncbi:hypothetical protein EV182_002026 [Spiromyces aspiralis]|uniref:Uncharacterized protein n=1 Tax=Spiromyces aspiralis TaxID=68401 RepID=A0ACC1HI67_9FUNG|nr:hypothetical protein EV182_002026 [Spiromyces aspiralis]